MKKLLLIVMALAPAAWAGEMTGEGKAGVPRLPLIVMPIERGISAANAAGSLFVPVNGIPANPKHAEDFREFAEALGQNGPLTAIRNGGTIALVPADGAGMAALVPLDGGLVRMTKLTDRHFELLKESLETGDYLGAHAALAGLFDAAAPAAAVLPADLGPLKERFTGALEPEVFSSLTNVVEGWSVPHVDAPAFNYQVARQRANYQPLAHRQTRSNRQAVMIAAKSPGVIKLMLMEVEKKLAGRPARPLLNEDPAFLDFYRLVQSAVAQIDYNSGDALVYVGWGKVSGKMAGGYTPDGPGIIALRLSRAIAALVFDPKNNPSLAPLLGRLFQ